MSYSDFEIESANNPFAPPQSDATTGNPFQPDISETDQAETLRREHLNHEASIQSMGFLYLFGGILCMLVAAVGMASIINALFITGANLSRGILVESMIVAAVGLVGILHLWVGYGVRRLSPQVHTPATILAAIGLLGIPIGTLINAYFLWLLQSNKGKFIMSPGYLDIVEQTPHVRYRSSIVVWIFMGLIFVTLVTAAIVAIMLA